MSFDALNRTLSSQAVSWKRHDAQFVKRRLGRVSRVYFLVFFFYIYYYLLFVPKTLLYFSMLSSTFMRLVFTPVHLKGLADVL